MAYLVKYRTDDGTIVGLWESNARVFLEAQRGADEPGYGYLIRDEVAPSRMQEQWRVLGDQVVQDVRPRTLQPQGTPMAGTGVTLATLAEQVAALTTRVEALEAMKVQP
jgi:hypothetical protein